MKFYEGQIFLDEFPQDACDWVNSMGNMYGAEIEPNDEGRKQFKIFKIPDPTPEEIAYQSITHAKLERAYAVSKITVEVDGMIFDGDETSQERLSRVVSIATALGVDIDNTYQTWVLADNTIAQVTIRQLARACELAGKKQTELWTKPYEETTE